MRGELKTNRTYGLSGLTIGYYSTQAAVIYMVGKTWTLAADAVMSVTKANHAWTYTAITTAVSVGLSMALTGLGRVVALYHRSSTSYQIC